MPSYTDGFKARMVQRMAGPERISANALSFEVGVSQGTLSRWLREAGNLAHMSKKKTKTNATKKASMRGSRRTAEEKLRIVMQAASLSEEALGELLRKEGIHQAQLEEWREKVVSAGTDALKDAKRKKSEQTPEARENRKLKSELRRKEKALAEAAALLVLQKKLQAYFSEGEESGTDSRSET